MGYRRSGERLRPRRRRGRPHPGTRSRGEGARRKCRGTPCSRSAAAYSGSRNIVPDSGFRTRPAGRWGWPRTASWRAVARCRSRPPGRTVVSRPSLRQSWPASSEPGRPARRPARRRRRRYKPACRAGEDERGTGPLAEPARRYSCVNEAFQPDSWNVLYISSIVSMK